MSNIFNAESAGMAAAMMSKSDEPVVPAEFAAHADTYREAFHRVRNAMGGGYQPRKAAKPTSDDPAAPTIPAKPSRRKPTTAAAVEIEPEATPEPPAKKSMYQILNEQEHLLQSA